MLRHRIIIHPIIKVIYQRIMHRLLELLSADLVGCTSSAAPVVLTRVNLTFTMVAAWFYHMKAHKTLLLFEPNLELIIGQ